MCGSDEKARNRSEPVGLVTAAIAQAKSRSASVEVVRSHRSHVALCRALFTGNFQRMMYLLVGPPAAGWTRSVLKTMARLDWKTCEHFVPHGGTAKRSSESAQNHRISVMVAADDLLDRRLRSGRLA